MSVSNQVDETYQDIVKFVLRDGDKLEGRNGITKRVIVEQVEFTSTPLISVRKTSWKNAIREWEWFMSGSCNIRDLHPSVQDWWKPWADPNGIVRSNYSTQFRHFAGFYGIVDQIELLVQGIREHPYSRRHVITTWNTSDMHHRSTPITNCHGTIIHVFVDSEDRLYLFTYQRSVDVIVGLPHNWIQYWAFVLWLCELTNKQVGSLIWVGGDVHIYENHNELSSKIVSTLTNTIKTPKLIYKPSCDRFKAEDFYLFGDYTPILEDKAEMVV